MDLTPEQFCAQWVNEKRESLLSSKLEFNMNNFITDAGKYTKECFESSFSNQMFYRSGKPWKPRASRWGKMRNHPILKHTGELLGSIKNIANQRHTRNRHRESYTIFTLEENHGQKASKKYKGKGYAAVHNTAPEFQKYHINGRSKRKPVQRQFIGFSPYIDEYILQHFVPKIFEGFPK